MAGTWLTVTISKLGWDNGLPPCAIQKAKNKETSGKKCRDEWFLVNLPF